MGVRVQGEIGLQPANRLRQLITDGVNYGSLHSLDIKARNMQRKVWAEANCPMARAIDLIGEWGSLLILREAFAGVRRFEEFRDRLQMSRNLLTMRLQKLVRGGILVRRPIEENAKRLEYVLTPMGEDLATTVVALRQWGDRWLFNPDPPPMVMVDLIDGAVIPKLEVRSVSGRLIRPAEVVLKPATDQP